MVSGVQGPMGRPIGHPAMAFLMTPSAHFSSTTSRTSGSAWGPEGFHANFAANSFADSHGDLWLGTWGKGLFRRHNGHLSAANPPGMPIATPIRALAEDRRGHIWIGTWFDGIYRYDGHSFHHYLLGIESPGNAVSSILPDR